MMDEGVGVNPWKILWIRIRIRNTALIDVKAVQETRKKTNKRVSFFNYKLFKDVMVS